MLDKTDYKYVLNKPDQNFSPERNKAVIESTINEYDKMREEKRKLLKDGIGERSEAIASFLKHVNTGKGTDRVESYFTPQRLAHLRGEDIINSLKNGNKLYIKPKPFFTQGGVVKDSTGVIVGQEVSNVKKKLQRQKQ
jgi:hypothetical protein